MSLFPRKSGFHFFSFFSFLFLSYDFLSLLAALAGVIQDSLCLKISSKLMDEDRTVLRLIVLRAVIGDHPRKLTTNTESTGDEGLGLSLTELLNRAS